MIIKKIYTDDIPFVKDMIIRMAIKNNFRYIEIENEVHIEDNIIHFYDLKEKNNEFPDFIETTDCMILPENNFSALKNKITLESIDTMFKEELDKIMVEKEQPKIKRKEYIDNSRTTKRIIKKRGML